MYKYLYFVWFGVVCVVFVYYRKRNKPYFNVYTMHDACLSASLFTEKTALRANGLNASSLHARSINKMVVIVSHFFLSINFFFLLILRLLHRADYNVYLFVILIFKHGLWLLRAQFNSMQSKPINELVAAEDCRAGSASVCRPNVNKFCSTLSFGKNYERNGIICVVENRRKRKRGSHCWPSSCELHFINTVLWIDFSLWKVSFRMNRKINYLQSFYRWMRNLNARALTFSP